jgi:hypothetical protein
MDVTTLMNQLNPQINSKYLEPTFEYDVIDIEFMTNKIENLTDHFIDHNEYYRGKQLMDYIVFHGNKWVQQSGSNSLILMLVRTEVFSQCYNKLNYNLAKVQNKLNSVLNSNETCINNIILSYF